MKYISLLNKFYIIPLILNIFVILSIGSILGLFSNTNRYLYQLISPHLPTPNKEHHSFVLVEIPDAKIENQLESILKQLNQYGAKKILIDISHQDRVLTQKKIDSIVQLAPQVSFIFPTFQYNRYKQLNGDIKFYNMINLYKQNNFFIFNKHSNPSISLDPTNFYPKYLSNHNGHPAFSKLHSNDFFETNVVTQLFQNKNIIISNFDNQYANLSTYTQPNNRFIHLNLLGLMLKSNTTHSWLKTFTPLSYILFMFCLILIWIYLSYLLSRYYSFNISFIVSIITPLFVYWFLLAYWNTLLPISELIIILPIITILLFKHWENLKSQEEITLLDHLSRRLHDKVVHKTFFNSDNYWNDIILLLNELFYLEKNIILEKREGEEYLKEVASYNCQFLDIQELRRDYHREPYLSALKKKNILKISRNFFENLNQNEEEYVVPLLSHNQIMGFWIFSIDTTNLPKMKHFQHIIHEYAMEVSKLLYKRSQFIQSKKDSKNNLKQMLNIEIKPKTVKSIENSLAIIEKRMLLNEVTLDKTRTKIVVYDLFGKIIQMNQSLSKTLQEEKISAFTMTASEMLAQFTNMSLFKIKQIIREVILTRESYTQLVKLRKSKKQYILNISAITKESVLDKFTIDYFFDTCGIVFEFYNFSYIENQYDYKKDILQETLLNNVKRLEQIENLVSDHHELKTLIYKSIFSINNLQSLLNQDTISVGDDLYPLDIVKILKLSHDTMKLNYPHVDIHFDMVSTQEKIHVLLSIHNGQRYIESLLKLLIEDNDENHAKISIIFQQKPHDINLIMKNYGNGIPQEQLNSYLQSQVVSPKYRFIQEAIAGINKTMGSVLLTSKIGEGITIKVSLKIVKL